MVVQRNSKQRQIILDAVRARKDHPTADQIYLDVRKIDDKISRGTVYRNLGMLSEMGEISSVKIPSADRFDFRLDKHYHMFCIKCRGVYDAPIKYIDEYDENVSKKTGFIINRHRVIFEGICSNCQNKMED